MSMSKPNAKKAIRKHNGKESIRIEKGTGNVFRDLGFSDAEAESLLIRCNLMIEIEKIIKEEGWTQAEAANILGIVQPRISELMHGKIERFTIDTLLQYLNILGRKITFTIENVA